MLKYILSYILFLGAQTSLISKDLPVKRKIKPVIIVTDRGSNLIRNTYLKTNLRNTPEAYSSNRLSEVLQKETGVMVNRAGAPGTQSTFSLRGANPEQTGVYLNSIPLQSAWGGPANLEYLPLELFETAEIYKSYTPSNLMGSNIGGSLNLIPRMSAYETTWFFRNSLSTLYGATLGAGYSDKNMLHYAESESSRNSYTFRNDNGTLSNATDDFTQTRKNEDVDRFGYTGFIQFHWGKVKFQNLADFLYRERGIPGPFGLPLYQVRQENMRGLERISFSYKFSQQTALEFHAGLTLEKLIVKDPARELTFSKGNSSRWHIRPDLGAFLLFRFWEKMAQSRTSITYAHTDLQSDSLFSARRSETEVAQRMELRPKALSFLTDGKVLVVQDTALGASQFGTADQSSRKNTLPAATVRAGFLPVELFTGAEDNFLCAECVEIYVLANYAERRPSLVELFGDGLTTLPSENLQNETAITNSGGLLISGQTNQFLATAQISVFLTGMQNLILFTANSQRTMIAVNAGKAHIMGLESELTLQKVSLFRIWSKYAYMEARDYSDIPYYNNKYLPNRPRHVLHTGVELQWHSLRFFSMLSYQGANYLDRYNSYFNYLRRRYFVSAGLFFHWGEMEQNRAGITLKNLLDETNPDIAGYPVPGRHAEIHMSMVL